MPDSGHGQLNREFNTAISFKIAGADCTPMCLGYQPDNMQTEPEMLTAATVLAMQR